MPGLTNTLEEVVRPGILCYTRTYIREKKSMKFMHFSDVHLGATPDAGKPWGAQRAKSIWETFAETVIEAGRQKVDFLLISGDLFHRQPLKRELKEVNYLFSQIPDVKVMLMAGNHDHLQPKSYYLDFEWAPNVFFFKEEEVTSFDFPGDNVTVYGMSYWHKKISKRCYDDLGDVNPERMNILLAHGGEESHIPYSANQVLGQGIDYIASGHIHMGRQLVADRAVMAGSLEPTESADVGPHGYWIGELTKRGGILECHCHFFPIKKCEYVNETIEVTPETTRFELEARIRKLVECSEPYKLYRIFLEGYVDAGQELEETGLEELPRVAAVYSELRPNYDYDRLREEGQGTLLARYIEEMQKLPQDVVTKKAMEYGVNALLGYYTCK